MLNKIILASSNTGKLNEFSELFADFNIEIIPQSQYQIQDAEETACTFIENALIKARHAAKESGLPALADDSGLVVPALYGAPGIFSARYAGVEANAKNNIQKLLNELTNIDDRQAYFHCTLVLVMHETDPMPIIAQANWRGMILENQQGEKGFGYDPVFYVPEQNMTAAEMLPQLKNKLSHRGRALDKFKTMLREII